ncbi:MAG: 6-carboxytetrahydropterin synthase [Phycisphaerales bacterium]
MTSEPGASERRIIVRRVLGQILPSQFDGLAPKVDAAISPLESSPTLDVFRVSPVDLAPREVRTPRSSTDSRVTSQHRRSHALLELARSVRFSISVAELFGRGGGIAWRDQPRSNTFAGWPSADGPVVYCDLLVRCRGQEDPSTGYLVGIGDIDAAVRDIGIELLTRAMVEHPTRSPAVTLGHLLEALRPSLGDRLSEIRWALTPQHAITVEADRMHEFLMSQHFDFAAAHHLWADDLDAEANRRVFGKCTNPHGHNYRVKVVARVPMPDGSDAPVLTLPGLEAIVAEGMLERLDHADLNGLDDLFGGRTPSVENIARVCHELLAGPIAATGAGLESITVWETEKTSCTYPAPVRSGAAAPRSGSEASGQATSIT